MQNSASVGALDSVMKSGKNSFEMGKFEKKTIKDYVQKAWKELTMLELEERRKERLVKSIENSPKTITKPKTSFLKQKNSFDDNRIDLRKSLDMIGNEIDSQVKKRIEGANLIVHKLEEIKEKNKLERERKQEERNFIQDILLKYQNKSI